MVAPAQFSLRSLAISDDKGVDTPTLVAASDLAHRIKSSLSAITMNLEYALEELPKNEDLVPIREALLDCRSAGERLLRNVVELTGTIARED